MDADTRDIVDSSTLLVAIDDTDTVDSEYGTGRVSRFLGESLDGDFPELAYLGSVRQQLLVDPRVPYTTHNSAACLLCAWPTGRSESEVVTAAATFLEDIAADGSDPGLCVGRVSAVTDDVTSFGFEAGEAVVEEERAYDLAAAAGLFLDEYGGTGEGVIGALAAVGRTATGESGRFVGFGEIRSFEGEVAVARLREAGLSIVTEDGDYVREGTVETGGWVRPLLRESRPTLEVERRESGVYRPTNLDE